jgi:glycerol-3-phosphate acyltransferase PlsY
VAGLVGAGRRARERARRVAAPVGVVAASFLAGSVPYSQLAARAFAGADLRRVGSGTVSGTALFAVAGFGPLAAAGVMEVAKGTVGPLLATRMRVGRGGPWGREGVPAPLLLGACAAGAAIAGHDWSPWLGGAGGRGLSPALGATLVLAPEGAVVLTAGMAAGRILRQSGLVTLLAVLSLVPVLGTRRGAPGIALGLAICTPVLAKRVLGNPPAPSAPRRADGGPRVPLGARLASRLLFDREPRP